jgi:hypothetical protein
VYFSPAPIQGNNDFVAVYVWNNQAWDTTSFMAKCAGIGWIYFTGGSQAWSNDKQAWLPTFSICGG